MKILMEDFCMSYTKSKVNPADPLHQITDWFNICRLPKCLIAMERLNYSDLLKKYYMSPGINFEDLDISQHINIESEPIKLKFFQEVYTYLLRCNDLNMCYVDNQDYLF